jgi:ZIP family zinc transporter
MTMTMTKHAGSVLSLFLFGVRLTIGQNSTTDVGGSELNVDGTPDIDESPEDAEEMDEILNENRRISVEGEAFLLVIAAGLCTAIGASVVFFPKLACLAKPNILCLALGFAAGIMLYISMIDIFTKSIDGYLDQGHDEGKAFIYANLSFFGGCLVMLILDVFVDQLLKWDTARAVARGDANLVDAPIGQSTREGIDEMREDFVTAASQRDTTDEVAGSADDDAAKEEKEVESARAESGTADDDTPIDTTAGEQKGQLTHMSWAMFAAIAIHNFPEGMVTYLAYTQDAAVGVALAIGIAIHNIPEGLVVAMPLFYATGRRFYSFCWGTVSGLTEPLGALIVWGILKNGVSGNTNGVLFGLVAGMMTVISVDELLPTAHKYASNPKTVTFACVFGMFFIASSLMLFQI